MCIYSSCSLDETDPTQYSKCVGLNISWWRNPQLFVGLGCVLCITFCVCSYHSLWQF